MSLIGSVQYANKKYNELFRCSFADMKIVKEIRKGFASTFMLECAVCAEKLELCTDDPEENVLDVNTAAVSGIISIGCGLSQLKQFAAVLNMPSVSKYK